MRLSQTFIRYFPLLPGLLASSHALAADSAERTVTYVGSAGVPALWILANISYAGMRAQGSRSKGWRILAFIFGFPGTLVSYLAVDENSERAYGIQLPRK